MSNSMNFFAQGQAVAPASTANMPPPIPLPSVVPSNNGGTGAGQVTGPIIFQTVHASTQGSISAQPPLNAATLADRIAREGVPSGALLAARHHRATNPTNPPTMDELLGRVVNAQVSLGGKYFDYHQDLPNAVALRLLAPSAGPSYTFEENETTFTNGKGNTITGRKCGGPGCEFRNSDHSRHMNEMHIRDPVTALFCPYKYCEQVHFAGRVSQMKDHIMKHEKRNERARRKRRATIPLSSFSLFH